VKHLIVIAIMFAFACVVPTNEGGDNAPDVEEAPTPDASVVVEKGVNEAYDGCVMQCDRLLQGHPYCAHPVTGETLACYAQCAQYAADLPARCYDEDWNLGVCEYARHPWHWRGCGADGWDRWFPSDPCASQRSALAWCRLGGGA
jgi:hypothetical protein